MGKVDFQFDCVLRGLHGKNTTDLRNVNTHLPLLKRRCVNNVPVSVTISQYFPRNLRCSDAFCNTCGNHVVRVHSDDCYSLLIKSAFQYVVNLQQKGKWSSSRSMWLVAVKSLPTQWWPSCRSQCGFTFWLSYMWREHESGVCDSNEVADFAKNVTVTGLVSTRLKK